MIKIVTKKGIINPYDKTPIYYLETIEKSGKIHRSYKFLKLLITMQHVKEDRLKLELYNEAIKKIEEIIEKQRKETNT